MLYILSQPSKTNVLSRYSWAEKEILSHFKFSKFRGYRYKKIKFYYYAASNCTESRYQLAEARLIYHIIQNTKYPSNVDHRDVCLVSNARGYRARKATPCLPRSAASIPLADTPTHYSLTTYPYIDLSLPFDTFYAEILLDTTTRNLAPPHTTTNTFKKFGGSQRFFKLWNTFRT